MEPFTKILENLLLFHSSRFLKCMQIMFDVKFKHTIYNAFSIQYDIKGRYLIKARIRILSTMNYKLVIVIWTKIQLYKFRSEF